jgi:hypothetical protein
LLKPRRRQMHGYPAKVAPAGSNRSDESPHVIIGHRASRENWPPATMPTTASEPTGGPEAPEAQFNGQTTLEAPLPQ